MDTSSNAVEADGDRGSSWAFAFPAVNWLPGHLTDLERQLPLPLPDHFLAQATCRGGLGARAEGETIIVTTPDGPGIFIGPNSFQGAYYKRMDVYT
jgi:hypothetical protein